MKEQIECCDEEIVQIGQRSPHQMLSTIDPSEFDWDTIAVHHLGGTRTAMECRLHFEHELKPGINTDPNWSKVCTRCPALTAPPLLLPPPARLS